jgi:hypothetical protein
MHMRFRRLMLAVILVTRIRLPLAIDLDNKNPKMKNHEGTEKTYASLHAHAPATAPCSSHHLHPQPIRIASRTCPRNSSLLFTSPTPTTSQSPLFPSHAHHPNRYRQHGPPLHICSWQTLQQPHPVCCLRRLLSPNDFRKGYQA